MEQSEQEEIPLLHIKVGLDDQSRLNMRIIAAWAIVSGITGFIALILFILSNLQSLDILSRAASYPGGMKYFILALVALLVYTLLNFLLNFFLVRFGNSTRQGIDTDDLEKVDAGIKFLNSYVKVLGNTVIILVAVIFILFIQSV